MKTAEFVLKLEKWCIKACSCHLSPAPGDPLLCPAAAAALTSCLCKSYSTVHSHKRLNKSSLDKDGLPNSRAISGCYQ